MSSKHFPPASSSQDEPDQLSERSDPENEDLRDLPLHIQAIREGLLDFDRFLGLQAAMLVSGDDGEDSIPLSAYKPDGGTESQRAREREFVESTQNLVENAAKAEKRREWKVFVRKWMRERMDSAQDSTSASQKSLACVNWSLWAFQKRSEEGRRPGTSPDMYLGFHTKDSETLKGFDKDPCFSNYTTKTLTQLWGQGLELAPLFDHSFEAPMVCFPWAIYYIFGRLAGDDSKSTNSSSQSMIRRATGAAAASLSIFEGLAKFAEEKQDGRHIPPTILITFAGPEATVWLAYLKIDNKRRQDQKMIRIWEGNVSKVWDALQFCRIIENLLFWTQNCLKPMVTRYLDQWGARYHRSVPNVLSQLEKEIEMKELVHRVRDRLSSLCIPDRDLPALIRQAVVFQEVMRPTVTEGNTGSILEEAMKASANIGAGLENPKGLLEKTIPPGSTDSHEEVEAATPTEKDPIQQKSKNFNDKTDYSRNLTSQQEGNFASNPVKNNEVVAINDESSGLGADVDDETTEETRQGSQSIKLKLQNQEHEKTVNAKFNKSKDLGLENSGEMQENSGEKRSEISPPLAEVDLPDSIKYTNYAIEMAKYSPKPPLNFVQRTLHSMTSRLKNGHVMSLKRQRLHRESHILEDGDGVSVKKTSLLEKRKTSSAPFSSSFHLSFKVDCWSGPQWDEYTAESSLQKKKFHGPYPTLHIWLLEDDTYQRMKQYVLHIRKLIQQQDERSDRLLGRLAPVTPQAGTTEVILPPILRVKIPLRGKNIMVRLPAMPPAPATSQEEPKIIDLIDDFDASLASIKAPVS